LQLLGRLGEHPGFLLGVERVALRLPLQVDAGLVVLHVAGRVAVQVANIEARPGFLAVLLAFDADAVLLAVHDRVLAAHHAADRAQCLGELVRGVIAGPCWPGHVLGLPALELGQVGFRPGVPGLRGFVPHGAGRLGGDAFAVGNGEILARRGGFSGCLGSGLGSGRRRPPGEGGWIHTGRDIPGLFLTIPARTQRLRLVLLRVGNVDPDLAGLAGLVYLTGLA
jgi:hypothetical protein